MEYFGLAAFVLVLLLVDRVGRIERLLRENGIRPAGSPSLARQLENSRDRTVTVVYDDGINLECRVLDVDEEWVLLRADEGRKKERELLLRLDSVKNIKVR